VRLHQNDQEQVYEAVNRAKIRLLPTKSQNQPQTGVAINSVHNSMFSLPGLIVALAYCFYNVIAVWGGLSRAHWSGRITVLGASLTPLLLLPNVEPGSNEMRSV
jgi:spore maturation protein SpmA